LSLIDVNADAQTVDRRVAWPRRVLRFRLRTLLIVLTLVGIWIGLTANRANRQRRAVEVILADGGQFVFDHQLVVRSASKSRAKLAPDELPGPSWLRRVVGDHYFVTPVHLGIYEQRLIVNRRLGLLRELPDLAKLWFVLVRLTDADMSELPPLCNLHHFSIGVSRQHPDANQVQDYSFLTGYPNLRELDLRQSLFSDDDVQYIRNARYMRLLNLGHSEIGDEGLRQLQHLRSLEFLSLSRTNVTDAGLVHLRPLSNLNQLRLIGSAITDAGLIHLKALSSLRGLWLMDTAVTDAGIEHLRHIPGLEFLGLTNTNTTEAGITRLRAALPNCRIRL
jgi:hypothetical protein